LGFIDQQIPRIILGRVAGATELGHFVFARRIVENSVTLLSTSVKDSALSAFAVIQTDLGRVRSAYAEGVSLTTTLVFPACAGIVFMAPQLVPLLVGERWVPAVLLLQLLVLASLRQCYHIWNNAVLRGLGKPHLLLASSMMRTLVIVVLVFLFLSGQSVGTCIAILAGSFLSWPIAIMFVKRVTGIGILNQLRPGAVPLLATAVMSAVLWIVRELISSRFSLGVTAGSLVATGVVAYVAALACFDRERFSSLLRIARSVAKNEPHGSLPPAGTSNHRLFPSSYYRGLLELLD
jgi:PST family polysaccharide transporter